jgi:hypothetical protein
MKNAVTLIKFMTKEELVNMLIQIKNFRNPVTKKRHHGYVTGDEIFKDKWHRAKHKFNMNNLDYVDALIFEDGGYVRYHGACDEVLDMLKVKFGFEIEE